jgi:hypothetical protein
MRWKIVLAAGLIVAIGASSSCTYVYRSGIRNVIFNGILEAGRLGVVDQKTAERTAIDVDGVLGGGNRQTAPTAAPNSTTP